jgi:hypothetical protein
MIIWLIELEGIWKKVVSTVSEVLAWHLRGETIVIANNTIMFSCYM